jgi:hypothetical protein
MAGDSCAREVVKTLASHFDHWNNPDVGLAGSKLIGTRRGQGEAKIEGIAQPGIGGMLKSPHQGHSIQVTDSANAGLKGGRGRRIQEFILALPFRSQPKQRSPTKAAAEVYREGHKNARLFQYRWCMLRVSPCGIFCEKGRFPAFRLVGES